MIRGIKPAPLLPEDVSKIESIFENAEARQLKEVQNQKQDVLMSMRKIGAIQAAPNQSASSTSTVGVPPISGCRITEAAVETGKKMA